MPSADRHRPRYHFAAPANWMNDPNGVIQWRGEYHLFYQYNPHGALWGDIHWGHAVSRDLVHWEHLPIALAPTPGSPDEGGCWSGCAVDAGDRVAFLYTGVAGADFARQRVCLAYGDARLVTLEKHPDNPVIRDPPEDLVLVRNASGVVQYRDPAVWRERDGWHMIVGSGIAGVGGAALLYRSSDLLTWEFLHPLCVGDLTAREPAWTGTVWECPDFFPLGDRHVLMVSAWDEAALAVAHMIGDYADHRFTPAGVATTDYGCWYAPQSFLDERGRRICWGWLRDLRQPEAQVAAGWSGVMALPRVLTLLAGDRLGAVPVPETEVLRGAHQQIADLTIAPGADDHLPTIGGDSLELAVELVPGEAGTCGLVVRRSPAGEEATRIIYDRQAARLWIDRSRSSLDPTSLPGDPTATYRLPADGVLRLRLFLDASVLEVFAGGELCFGTRIYPSRDDSTGLDLFATEASAQLLRLDAWEMAASS